MNNQSLGLSFLWAGYRLFALTSWVAVGVANASAQNISAPMKDNLPVRGIVAELSADFDQDGITDRLVFTKSEEAGDFVDLHVFKGIKDATTGKEGFRLLSKTVEFGYGVFNVTEKRKGVFTVESGNAQGRYKWEQTLTIGWRSGMLRVIGITYVGYDSILEDKEEGITSCDVNLATGKGIDSRKRTRSVSLKPVPVADWSDDKYPEMCRG